MTIDPETFQIMDGKLYLLYNSWGNDTKVSQNKERPLKLKKQADGNWSRIKHKK